jgi:hypothetical protein
LPEFVPQWQSLNFAGAATAMLAKSTSERREQYYASIAYELEMLVNLITSEGGEDDLFILMGDHQPSRVARFSDGWDTPIHIISRDATLIETLLPYNFTSGLDTFDNRPTMQHEGFYSLLMRVLLKRYGHNPEIAPDYLPEGVPLR